MGFSHLFILQLRSWLHGLGPPDSDSKPVLLDLLILDFMIFDLLIFDFLLFNFWIPWPFMLELTLQIAQALWGNVNSWIVSGPRPSYFCNSQASNPFASTKADIILRVRLQQANHLTTFQVGSMGPNNARLFTLQYYCRLSYGLHW